MRGLDREYQVVFHVFCAYPSAPVWRCLEEYSFPTYRQDNNSCPGTRLSEFERSINSPENRHADIRHNNVRMEVERP
jgi:hypothetical protein